MTSKVFQEQSSMKGSKVVAQKLRNYDELLQYIKNSIQK